MLHQIGIGALGPVFRTYEPTRDRLVAVKVFRLDIVPEQAQALADALGRATQASLFHPSIVEPIAAGMEGTVAYRAEEYVAAESLDVAMRHYAPAPIDKALPFITQLAGAIDFARAAGVGHGALHPRDVFVTPDEARATGFGVVEALEATGLRAPVRRPYTAPERIAGGQWATPADVFSLAAIAFELLTGRRPAGTGQQIGQLADGPHAGALQAVLARAMDDIPENRYPTALAFAAALEAAARGEAVVSPPMAAVARTPIDPAPTAEASPSIAASVIAPASVDPTPGEFEIEKELDPVLAAIDDDTVVVGHRDEPAIAERDLFEDPTDRVAPMMSDETDPDEFAHLAPEPERYADEFVEEQRAEAESRRPLEASYETVPRAAPAEPAMFATTGSVLEPEAPDYSDRPRPTILPYAVMLMVGVLIGFGAAYFMLFADRGGTEPAAPPAAATSGPATSVTPGQYSEQKVTPPSPAAAGPATQTPPPIPDETPGTARGAAPGTAGTATGRAAAPAAPAPVATSGRLTVTSTPSRASVTVNGAWRGRTPLTIENLRFGRYVIRVVQPGYTIARDEFTLSAQNAAHEFSPRLQRGTPASPPPSASTPRPATQSPARSTPPASQQSFSGSLYVDSRPRGARVFVDNRLVGQTPLSIPELSIGSHVVRLEMAGKQTWSTSTRVVAGETARVTGSLEDRN